MRRPVLVLVLLLLAALVYNELRLPVPIDAQGRAAVYERVSVVDTDANALRVAGGAAVAGAVAAGSVTTGTPIAPQYLGTGTRDGTRFLKDTGVWAGVSPPTAVSYTPGGSHTTGSSTFQLSSVAVTLATPSATSDVLLSLRVSLYSYAGSGNNCEARIERASNVVGPTWATGNNNNNVRRQLELPILDVDPGAGTHTYALWFRREAGNGHCSIRGVDSFTTGYLLGQVLQ